MKKRYRIVLVQHSGRKGPRSQPVDDPKYNGIVNSIVESDLLYNLQQFQNVHWDFYDTESQYDYWVTSSVIQLQRDRRNGQYILETLNTIYTLEEVDNGDPT